TGLRFRCTITVNIRTFCRPRASPRRRATDDSVADGIHRLLEVGKIGSRLARANTSRRRADGGSFPPAWLLWRTCGTFHCSDHAVIAGAEAPRLGERTRLEKQLFHQSALCLGKHRLGKPGEVAEHPQQAQA